MQWESHFPCGHVDRHDVPSSHYSHVLSQVRFLSQKIRDDITNKITQQIKSKLLIDKKKTAFFQ